MQPVTLGMHRGKYIEDTCITAKNMKLGSIGCSQLH